VIKKRKIVGSAILGNIVEYYDFGIYAVFAPIIGKLFFPAESEFVQTLYALSVFALGFLMRPLGGYVFGHIGDRVGRKVALTISIVGMAICTFFIGILPTYAQIGLLAPILLILIRLFQGLCVGGESAGVAIFILEHLEGYKPGLIGSIVMASNMVGTLLAYFVGIGISTFFGYDDPLYWRVGFILGGIMGFIGLYMRFQLQETPHFTEKKESSSIVKHPLLTAIKKHWPRMLVVLFLGATTAALAYTIRGYLNVFFQNTMHYTADESLYFTTVGLFIMIVFMPIFGILADKVGYRKFFYYICYITIFTIIPIYSIIADPSHNVSKVMFGVIALGILASAVCAPAYPYAIKAFEVELRYSGVAFSWNTGLAIFGGTTPAISSFLSEKYGVIAPAYYILFLAITFMAVSYSTRKHKH
jgi:MFS transporter, MHS family, proline/betaine transporter